MPQGAAALANCATRQRPPAPENGRAASEDPRYWLRNLGPRATATARENPARPEPFPNSSPGFYPAQPYRYRSSEGPSRFQVNPNFNRGKKAQKSLAMMPVPTSAGDGHLSLAASPQRQPATRSDASA